MTPIINISIINSIFENENNDNILINNDKFIRSYFDINVNYDNNRSVTYFGDNI